MTTNTETQTSEGYIAPSNSFSTILCGGEIVTQIVDDFGANVKLRQRTTTTYNEYGDPTETTSDSWTKAYIHQWTATDDEVKEGIYKNGQIMFVFKGTDESKIKTGNFVWYNNEWYRITSIQTQMMAGRKYLINATVEKKPQ